MSDRMTRRFNSVQVTIPEGEAVSTEILELEEGAGLLIHRRKPAKATRSRREFFRPDSGSCGPAPRRIA